MSTRLVASTVGLYSGSKYSSNPTVAERPATYKNQFEARVVGRFEDYAEMYRGGNAEPYDYIAKLIKQFGINGHILDIGCGSAFSIDLLENEFNEISLVEPNKYFRKNWFNRSWSNDNRHILHLYPYTIEQSINDKLFKKNSIDAIIVYHSIYHFNIETLKDTINSIISYLKPNGVVIISVLDDNRNKDIVKMYNKVLTKYKAKIKYKLSTTLEDILNDNNNINYNKQFETTPYIMTFEDQLNLLKWLTIQDCMNQNYFPNGLSDEQMDSVDTECRKFIKHKIKTMDSKNDKCTLYYTAAHFIITKKKEICSINIL